MNKEIKIPKVCKEERETYFYICTFWDNEFNNCVLYQKHIKTESREIPKPPFCKAIKVIVKENHD